MELYELRQMQSLPLHLKIHKTCARIQEWYDAHEGNVYVAFSGGLDSTVLVDITHRLNKWIPLVFSNTGLEYPEIVQFVKQHSPLNIVRPEHNYAWVVEHYGYPIISKRVSRYIRDCQHADENNKNVVRLRLTGLNRQDVYCPSMKLPEKWKYLIDAPFKISEQCCDWIKKKPLDKYSKETGAAPMTGELAEESNMREKTYLKQGCNFFGKKDKSTPLGFWTHQDILAYIVVFNVPYCKIYGDIIYNPVTDKLETTGEQRTGCYACMFGVHLEKNGNRFTRMKLSHPNQYDYCINRLGQGKILDYIGVDYK